MVDSTQQSEPPSKSEPMPTKELDTDITDANREYQADDADVVLISSDNLRFKVHSYHLMAASPIFREMLKVGRGDSNNEVDLTDKEIEGSKTISLFLDILYGHTLSTPTSAEELGVYRPLISFVLKYEATTALQTIKLTLRSWFTKSTFCSWTFFKLGVQSDDGELITQFIKNGGGFKWTPPKKDANGITPPTKRLKHGIIGASAFDMSAWPWKDLKELPFHHLFALLRTSRKYPNMVPGVSEKWKDVANEYQKVMEELRREKLV